MVIKLLVRLLQWAWHQQGPSCMRLSSKDSGLEVSWSEGHRDPFRIFNTSVSCGARVADRQWLGCPLESRVSCFSWRGSIYVVSGNPALNRRQKIENLNKRYEKQAFAKSAQRLRQQQHLQLWVFIVTQRNVGKSS